MAVKAKKGQATPDHYSGKRTKNQWSRAVTTAHKKQKFLEKLAEGYTTDDCARFIQNKPGIHKYYLRSDTDFAVEYERIMAMRQRVRTGEDGERSVPDFPEFCEKYLHQKLFNHQLQWYDLLEGREPRNLHPSQRFKQGDPNFIVVNTPPNHGKSTTITQNYVTWRIIKQPDIRIIIVSKEQTMAKDFLYAIKARLTSGVYEELIRDFAPAEGFDKAEGAEWSAIRIRIGGIHESLDEGAAIEKDPTCQALGIGGHIYGKRADLIILDDCVTLDNVAQVDNQIRWLQQEVDSRLEPETGRMLVVGTRVAPVDLYSELLSPERYPGEEPPWSYLSQPAVLEYADEPADWETLWPFADHPPKGYRGKANKDGLYPRWNGVRLAQVRSRKDPTTWAMSYQQEQVSDDAVFKREAVMGCVDEWRMPGNLFNAKEGGGRDKGQDWYILAGLDPASSAGFTAMAVAGINRRTGQRRVLEVSNQRMTPFAKRKLIKEWTTKFAIDEWRVEKNSYQEELTQDAELVRWMAQRGVLFREHLTGRNKWDPDLGVEAMAMLFQGWEDKQNLLSLPSKRSPGIQALIEQLVSWIPDAPKTQKTDCVMALWFINIRANEMTVNTGGDEFMYDNEYLSPNDMAAQEVIHIDSYLARQRPSGVIGRLEAAMPHETFVGAGT